MFTAIVERLSGKAALQEEIRIMKLALEQSTNGVTMLTKARNNLSERCKELEQQKDMLQIQYDAQATELRAVIELHTALNSTYNSERDEWQRQLEKAQSLVEISTQQFATVQAQFDDLIAQYTNGSEEYQRDLISLQQKHNEVVEERDSLQDRCNVLQAKYDDLQASNEHIAIVDSALSADYAGLQEEYRFLQRRYALAEDKHDERKDCCAAAMALLAELYEARIKKGSVKFWDTRYLDLKAQYDQLAPVEVVEAKENNE